MKTPTITDALRVLTPTAIWNMHDSSDYSSCIWLSPDITQPTQQEVDEEIATLTAEQPLADCKAQATKLLYETDWTTIADVGDPNKSNPYLVNVNDFVVYRSSLRQLAVHPVVTPTWPTKPAEQWSS
jgi:hypothetical protein